MNKEDALKKLEEFKKQENIQVDDKKETEEASLSRRINLLSTFSESVPC